MSKHQNLRTWMQCKETVKRGLSRIHKYGEGALEPLTQQCAKSADGVSGFAGKQVSAVRKF